MKKIFSILICVVLGISSAWAANTIVVNAFAVNADGTKPVGGTVTLKVTESKSNKNKTVTTDPSGDAQVSVTAVGSDGLFLGIGAYTPKVSITISPSDGFFVEGIYLVNGSSETSVGVSNFNNAGEVGGTFTYKVVFAKPNSSVLQYIDFSMKENPGLFTGMEEDQAASGLYKEKTEVNLSSTFASDGTPLFDVLYIFGVTEPKEGSLVNTPDQSDWGITCNARVPLYIYYKSESENRYDLESELDATGARFDHGDVMNNKKLYFTGYCPFANIGYQPTDEGWMFFRGSSGARVDIYLENCEILGKSRTIDGSHSFDPAKYATNYLDLYLGDNALYGYSSIFVFQGENSTAYKPYIHIRGENHLKGQSGFIHNVTAQGGMDLSSFGLSIKNVPVACAPITLRQKNEKNALGMNKFSGITRLTMDDVWPTSETETTITNGSLTLDAYPLGEAERCPAIELGSKYGSLEINGGQYHLRNCASEDGQYTNNLVFSYRNFSEASIANLNGFGGDMSDCVVIINSGTFTMYKNMYSRGGSQYYLDQDNFLDLRLPYGDGQSQINGGTFNGITNVVFCKDVSTSGGNPKNAQNELLCLVGVPADDDLLDNLPVTNVQLPNEVLSYGYEGIVDDLSAAGAMDALVEGTKYGGQSLNADNTSYVHLMLPVDAVESICETCEKIEEAQYRNWATALPKIRMKAMGGELVSQDFGGDKEVEVPKSGESSFDIKTNQLMYVDMYGMQNFTYDNGGLTFQLDNSSKSWGNFTNEEDYEIQKHLNIVKLVEADQWYCFTAPFSITKVSVIEIGSEELNSLADKRELAMNKQMEINSKMWISLQQSRILPDDNGRSAGQTFEELLSPMAVQPLIDLIHYNGENISDANYYLYELENEVFGTEDVGDSLKIKWKPVTRNTGDTLMYKGKTYAIQFPWCPMCNDLGSRTQYDYWSKKFIRFYGEGPQTIYGKKHQEESILSTVVSENNATLVGNYTFADMTLPEGAGYIHNTTTDIFDLNEDDGYIVKPTEGYLLFGGSQKGMPIRISRAGQMIYDTDNEASLNNIPTIGDRTSIMIFGAGDGFEILSLCDQLVAVYNLQGNIIFQQYMTAGEQVYVGTGAGVFVVRGENETIKIMVD